MNGDICIWCEKPMGNSLHTIRHGRDRKKHPIHKKCYWDNSIHEIFDKIEDSNKSNDILNSIHRKETCNKKLNKEETKWLEKHSQKSGRSSHE